MQTDWQAIAIADAIKPKKAYKIWLNEKPWVLFRDAQGNARLLDDICPHRLASLSEGKINQGEIQCPYHGWQFNHQGICTRIPGLEKVHNEKALLKSQAVIEQDGLIWASENAGEFIAPLSAGSDIDQDNFFIQTQVQSDLLTLVENFLDGFHTHFVHAGLIRRDQSRQIITAEVKPLSDGLEVVYRGESNQNGFLSRWFEPDRGESFARFRLPNFAEIEYRGPKNQLNLLVSLWAVTTKKDQLSVIARIATQKGWWPAWIKKALLKRFSQVILKQDQQIVEKAYTNKKLIVERGEQVKTLSTELDILHPWLEKIISNKTPQVFDPYTREIAL
jgi:phenylpropionate dioxygenase-like ring-hydroxylating dioxygenase large terminal subunit